MYCLSEHGGCSQHRPTILPLALFLYLFFFFAVELWNTDYTQIKFPRLCIREYIINTTYAASFLSSLQINWLLIGFKS